MAALPPLFGKGAELGLEASQLIGMEELRIVQDYYPKIIAFFCGSPDPGRVNPTFGCG
jgi:hypothetical protein